MYSKGMKPGVSPSESRSSSQWVMKFDSRSAGAVPFMDHSVLTVIFVSSEAVPSLRTLTCAGRLLVWSLDRAKGMVALHPVPTINPIAAFRLGLLRSW